MDAQGEQKKVNVDVTVTEDSPNKYSFAFDGKYFEPNGDFNFAVKELNGKSMLVEFSIAEGSAPGVLFAKDKDAMWLIEKDKVGPKACPPGQYQGRQFTDFKTINGGKSLQVLDLNNDRQTYRYALRFQRNGKPIVCDPDGSNGPHD